MRYCMLILAIISSVMPIDICTENLVDSLPGHLKGVVVIGREQNDDIIPAQLLSGEGLRRLNSNRVAVALRSYLNATIDSPLQ